MRTMLVIFISVFYLLFGHYAFAASSQQVGSVSFIEGVCDITSANAETVIAAEGQPVYLGDRIRTKNYSKAQIQLLDKSVVKIAPSSCITVEEFTLAADNTRQSCRVKLTRGKIEAIVSKTGAPETFRVDTPNAHGTVKGSDIFISYLAGRTAVFVQEGAIAVGAASLPGSAVNVNRGDCVVVAFDKAPAGIRPVMGIEMKQHKKDVGRELVRKWIPAKDSAKMNAVIVGISGTVRIYKKDASDWRPVTVNDVVVESEKVQTGEDSKAEIRMGNGNVLYLQANTELGFSKLRYDPATGNYENTFDMSVGEVIGVIEKIDSKSTFQLRTPTAVSGVRGTVLRVVVPPPTIDIPIPETRVFFEGGSGIVTSLLSGQTQQLFAGQNAVVNPAGKISAPLITPAGQRVGPGIPMPMAKPVDGYMPGKTFSAQGSDMAKPLLPPLPPPLPGEGQFFKPPIFTDQPPLPPFEQVFQPDVLAQIPCVKASGTDGSITAANFDLTIRKDGTWSAQMHGDFVSPGTSSPWDLYFTDLGTSADVIIFDNIQNPLTTGSAGVFSKGPEPFSFSGDIRGTDPDKSLVLGDFNGDYTNNKFNAQASGTWTDTGVFAIGG